MGRTRECHIRRKERCSINKQINAIHFLRECLTCILKKHEKQNASIWYGTKNKWTNYRETKVIIAKTEDQMQKVVDSSIIKQARTKFGIKRNAKNTKIMKYIK